MNQMQDEIAGRKVPTIASHGQPLPTEKTIDVGDFSSSQDGVGAMICEEWNTSKYFKTATSKEVTACLDIGADPKARDEDKQTPLDQAKSKNNLARSKFCVIRRSSGKGSSRRPPHDEKRNPDRDFLMPPSG